ncbi:MAG TPA: hypothetical protein VK985_08370 [Rariglobus sp.]|nr:hypothetical protein [Rariglobus sp.]
MNQLIDIFYFTGVPLAAIAALCGIYFRKKKIYLLASAVALLGAWLLTIENRERRYDLLTEHSFHSVDEIRSLLGTPDHVLKYKEGDERWMYSVRSTPWNTVQWFSIYKNHLLGYGGGRSIGLFYRDEDDHRDERESALAKKNLEALDKWTTTQK